MKSDNSRITFDPRKHYSGVRLQQGRVQIDADANEQSDIVNYRIETEAGDVIGLCGAPMHYPAFHIVGELARLSAEERTLVGNKPPDSGTAKIPTPFRLPDFLISAGRYYVNGILCENEQLISYLTQPDLPNAPQITEPGLYLIYVDVWERLLTALDDPSIREVALGGPDTATRTKTVWQVKHWLAVDRSGNKLKDGNCLSIFNVFTDLIAPSSGKLSARSKSAAATTDPCVVSPVAGYTGLENQLYRIEIHNGGGALDTTEASGTSLTRVENENSQIKASGNWTQQKAVEIFSKAKPMQGQLAFVKTVEGTKRGTKTLTLDIDLSQLPFSDALIREAGATFKWSRDNGVVVTAIQIIKGTEITVHDLGPDDTLGFKEGQWVEISDDALELAGLPGQLAQISNVDKALRRVTLKVAVDPLDATNRDGVNKDLHPKLRRWDGVGAVTFNSESAEDNFVELESGVQISFSPGTLRTGDYWTVPARTATADTQAGNIDWPADGRGQPLAQSPFGIEHHYCRLALADWDGSRFIFQDCRSLFPPITELTTMVYVSGDGQEALPGKQIQQPLQVGVFNGRWPVENASVQFSISSAAGRFGVPITDSNIDDGKLISLDGTGTPTNTITVRTDRNGIAGCFWTLDPRFGPLVDPSADRTSQQVEARLLDARGGPTPALVRFDGNLSVADEVAYYPEGCAALAGDTTVQRALDRLSRLVSLYEVSGNNQEVMPRDVGRLKPLEVLAANRCGPVGGQEVTFRVVSGTGTVTPERPTTSNDAAQRGIVRCAWTLDTTTPRQEVEAELRGAGPFAATTKVRFVANLSTADQVAYNPRDCELLRPRATVQEAIDQLSQLISLYEVSGNNQVVIAQSEMKRLEVRAANKCGPVAGQRVRFTAGSGSVSPADTTTDADGIARTTWTVDLKLPSQHVEATLVEAPGTSKTVVAPTSVVFNAFVSIADHVLYTPGDCALLQDRGTVQKAIDQLSKLISLYEVSGNNQIARTGAPQELRVLAANRCGPVKGQKVTFTLVNPDDDGSVTPEAFTDEQGIATATWTFSDLQSQQVLASLVEKSPKSLAAPTSVLFNANRSAEATTSSGGGCEITVGEGGQFADLEQAISSLLESDRTDICLCLLPGDHVTGSLKIRRKGLHVKISGCGRGSRLLFTETGDSLPTGSALFGSDLASFTMSDLEVFGENFVLGFSRCDDVTFARCHLTVENQLDPNRFSLIAISQCKRVQLENNVIVATFPIDANPQQPAVIFGQSSPELSSVFRVHTRSEFVQIATEFSKSLAGRSLESRKGLAAAITPSVQNAGRFLTADEVRSYDDFIVTLQTGVQGKTLADTFMNKLTNIRVAALAAVPASAIALAATQADTRIEDNQITGIVSFYGPPTQSILEEQTLPLIARALKNGKLVFTESLGNLYVRNNTMSRITVSEATIALLRAPTGEGRNLTGFYRRSFFTDNVLKSGNNCFVVEHAALSSDSFERELDRDAGAVIARAATYVGNFATDDIRLFNATGESTKAANLGINIADVFP